MDFNSYKKSFVTVTLILLSCSLFIIQIQKRTDKEINEENGDVKGTVTVSAYVPYNTQILVDPEKRVPPTGNDSVEVEIQFRSVGSPTPIYSTTVTTDSSGLTPGLSLDPMLLPDGNYDIAIKGISHLNKLFSNVTLAPLMDLSVPQLYAGDSHPSSDNYVNSIDISYEIINLYNSDVRADLNRDGKINSLDLSIQIYNLYEYGEL